MSLLLFRTFGLGKRRALAKKLIPRLCRPESMEAVWGSIDRRCSMKESRFEVYKACDFMTLCRSSKLYECCFMIDLGSGDCSVYFVDFSEGMLN